MVKRTTVADSPSIAADRAYLGVQDDPAIIAEVERLLSRRTRDIRLNDEINRLFRERIWPQTAKIIRAWMIWVAILGVLTLALNMLLLPPEVSKSMVLPSAMLSPIALAVAVVWRRPRAPWVQGSLLIAGVFAILLSVAMVGVSAGGEFYERHLNIMLFVAITAIIIFGIPLAWTVIIAALALCLYFVFQLTNPSLELGSALASALFFTTGVFATVAARRNMTILAQKTFLFELRDRRRVSELAEVNDRLEYLARTDPLTGLANRRWMTETIDHLWDKGKKTPERVAMLMCDIDEFKKLNDHLGHAEGDRCLVQVAGIIQKHVRRSLDHVARYGGEEFLVILPGMSEKEALCVAERVRENVEAAALPNPTSRVSRYVTLSIGIAVQGPDGENHTSEQLQRNADAALYRAKQSGRNRVVIHSPATSSHDDIAERNTIR
ncbi:MAG: GGDEF domain-containing protein [Hoeflea sp.]|uniref:GGDEF domain-containing protein n=1 Tax=Hoeflea sp. TaxID=1940281 RepID=UPI001D61E9F9|nr:diguanylate cyclase [Hoeflea sp.]MBU4530743.1 GGDEF domain-containing protein [Alphaproteobacteria bacterium]MBU4544742.1 GGDEF domain-containing protein [Alphaproteobacteria bacterium]MBU4549298.1 GGDEF domain-containing protein [Alphaproteobacteria bacterium]MBV1726337.1 GGDEF domain-containing protein [Hoeflea sp.]MBV1761679.1 GGDEF domain-containing protein [Hoeflea sp.]